MKKAVSPLLIVLLLTVTMMACGSNVESTTETSGEKESTAESESIQTADEVTGNNDTKPEEAEFADDGDISYVLAEDAEILEKHAELIDYIKEENYQDAEAYVHNLLIEQEKANAGDIADYLVEVEINQDNLFDYFELTSVTSINSFGEEETNTKGPILKSKLYDEGLLIYKVDTIPIEYTPHVDWNSNTRNLSDLFRASEYCVLDDKEIELKPEIIRMGSGKITYVKKEYVLSEKIEQLETNPGNYIQTIELKNGEIISRNINEGFAY